ncbi:hypothetical protein GA0070563_106413 [Micromonospora carbonacea]|uniref:Uncharacterized protein n=2 Tax=Micromonospora carbonacea TaxID=47853 RepID=A0A1C4YU78_9ACTN|nr:hypothetical protein GA0070563_106413 [Micromonospora carbonacea]
MVVLYLLNANRADRREYQEAIDRAERRADEAEVRRSAAEARLDNLQQAVDEARSARRAAEDHADSLLRELTRLRPHEPGGDA